MLILLFFYYTGVLECLFVVRYFRTVTAKTYVGDSLFLENGKTSSQERRTCSIQVGTLSVLAEINLGTNKIINSLAQLEVLCEL